MLVGIRHKDKVEVRASHARKEDGPFICPECQEVVLLHHGKLTAPHFRHKIYDRCSNSSGETEVHRQAKLEISTLLATHPAVSDVFLEEPFGAVRADIYAVIHGLKVAIEIQISTLSAESISARTSEYSRLGIHVLWIVPRDEAIDSLEFRPKHYVRWLHAAYFGRVYVWTPGSGLSLHPYHFEPRRKLIPGRQWYDEHGHLRKTLSYRKTLKRSRIAICGRPLHIVDDFHALERLPFESLTLRIPAARLYIDRRRVFEREEE